MLDLPPSANTARISYEKARLVAWHADDANAPEWIEHHVVYRSHGGADDAANLVSLCAAHHLHGVHMGWIRVRGKAPDRLQWQPGARESRSAAGT